MQETKLWVGWGEGIWLHIDHCQGPSLWFGFASSYCIIIKEGRKRGWEPFMDECARTHCFDYPNSVHPEVQLKGKKWVNRWINSLRSSNHHLSERGTEFSSSQFWCSVLFLEEKNHKGERAPRGPEYLLPLLKNTWNWICWSLQAGGRLH